MQWKTGGRGGVCVEDNYARCFQINSTNGPEMQLCITAAAAAVVYSFPFLKLVSYRCFIHLTLSTCRYGADLEITQK